MADDSSSRIYRRRFDTLITNADKTENLKSTSKSPANSIQSELQQSMGGKLAQEIQDELLICKICLENYKQPKSLSCLHTFCSDCLDNHIQGEVTYKKYSDYRDFTCPLCRKRTTLPIGGVRKLPDNFVVASLFEMIKKRKLSTAESADEESRSHFFCQICHKTGNKKREATAKCIDCCKLLCRNCSDTHRQTRVTQLHSLFDLNIEDDVICKVHPEEPVRFFCKPCQSCICVLCTFNEHSDHEVTQFTEAVIKYKTDIEMQLVSCQQVVEQYEERLAKIKNVETIIKTTENQITELVSKLIEKIKCRESQLLEEIQNVYGEEMIEIIKTKSIVENHLSDLKNTCNMTEIILQRKDIELLLLKKEIEEKLSNTKNLPQTQLPASISKIVKFIPGSFEFGCLQDMDRPMLTMPTCFRYYSEYNKQEASKSEQKCVDTQTDIEIEKPSTASKSVSTIPIQMANKAVNTRTRVIQQSKPRTNSVQLSNGSSNIFEVQPISSSEGKLMYINTEKILYSPIDQRCSSGPEKVRNCSTKELILAASEVLNEFVSKTKLESDISVIED